MCTQAHRYFIIHKPYDMVSQFISPHKVKLLGDLNFDFPEGTHAIGRLDKNSEGLLILTTNKQVTRLLFQASVAHKRTYLVQTKNAITEDVINQLRRGVAIKIKGGNNYITPPCDVAFAHQDLYKNFLQAGKDLRFTWITITLTEGKYHQVRKMIAAVRHRCRRLIRVAIDEIVLADLPPGNVIEINEDLFFTQLKLIKTS